jgi:pimeloyl-ACP methyl ester carboxylesterase
MSYCAHALDLSINHHFTSVSIPVAMSSFLLKTNHGLISITDTALENQSPVLMLLHGNSSSSKIWKHFFASASLTSTHRIIAFDLPGHGASSNAPDPEQSYTMRGYAELAVEILETLSIKSVVVLGWSLGGHIGIEMVPLLHVKGEINMKGLILVGTPPANGLAQTDRGFLFQDGHMSLAAKDDLSEADIEGFARSAGEPFEGWMEDDVRRTDGKARFLMWKSFAEGTGVDQRGVVESEEYKGTVLCVANGSAEPFVNLEYLEEIRWANLWTEKCVKIEGLGHAPFWEKPEDFQEMLRKFLEHCAREEIHHGMHGGI